MAELIGGMVFASMSATLLSSVGASCGSIAAPAIMMMKSGGYGYGVVFWSDGREKASRCNLWGGN